MAQAVPDLSCSHPPTGPWLNQEGGKFLALHLPSPSWGRWACSGLRPRGRACQENQGSGLHPQEASLMPTQAKGRQTWLNSFGGISRQDAQDEEGIVEGSAKW